MVVVGCSVPSCEFKTQDVSEALAIAMLQNHGLAHQNTTVAGPTQTPSVRAPSLDRPKIDVGVSTEEWNVFVRRWKVFRTGSNINETTAPAQLFQCAGPQLGDNILKTKPEATSGTLEQLLETMRSLAVIPVATGVLRTELLQLRQERDEPFRSFAAKVKGKAETCEFLTKCECGKNVDYTPNMSRDVLLNGIADPDIRREVLGTKDIIQTSVNDVISLVESKEKARNALPSSSISTVSSFRRQQNPRPDTPAMTPKQAPHLADRRKEAQCPDCHQQFKIYTEGARGWNSKPHQVCITCYRTSRRNRRPRGTPSASTSAVSANEYPGQISQLSAVHPQSASSPRHKRRRQRHRKSTHSSTNKNPPVTLDHHVFSKGEWRRARLQAHPTVNISITTDPQTTDDGASRENNTIRQAHVSAIADTGAQSDIWSLKDFLACGFPRDVLAPVSLSLSAANRSPIPIEGAFFAKLAHKNSTGQEVTCRSMVYVSSAVNTMYLSCETLFNLAILPEHFPSSTRSPQINSTRHSTEEPSNTSSETCSCPHRDPAPVRPSELPFQCTPENNENMKEWLLTRYASSTFNKCPHQTLPRMEGPEIEIHVDPDATPKACHTPATVPIHWQQRVYDDLIRDEALGVIERVPYGEPVTWCHRMVVTRKHDGSPRRTVDLSPLNKFCQRETFATESPFHLARRVPKDSWKTVTDAWNGYHSVPLRQSDRHLTTFITPFGRWRYTRAPQGFLSSGDGYNRRFDAILASFDRKERCVDDTIHYDSDLEEHWWRTIDLLTRLGQAGVVLNPDKFQFASKCVDFAGFRISDSTIEPLPKYLDAIRDFPSPTSTTDIRSWFGLVNQVANYAQLRDKMSLFKPFLSPRCKFSWSAELEEAFQASKQAIIDAIHKGVEIFDMKRRTCLRPDWSTRGIGYFLLQQHCDCPSGIPDCCPEGWRITLAGSRFLSPAEQRYAAIEGEALAVAWGLEQSRYFTQGCDNLVVVTDHKPLTKILGDRTLDEITNTRLFRLKQRTLPWRFDIVHLPGKSNYAADATSRHPSPSGSTSPADTQESMLLASICSEAKQLGIISWAHIAQQTAADRPLSRLLRIIEQGNQESYQYDPDLATFWPVRDSIYIEHGALMYQDRVVVPQTLRPQVLQHLHAAHQGISSMEQRARMIIYWPGMTKDIRTTREQCVDCNRNAPSQASTPPLPSPPPSTPFEAVFADFFTHGGQHYLVVGDRLSGWVEVFGSPSSTNLAGATGLIRHLRSFFATFGVPEEISSDGGPEFTAGCTEAFLRHWGIRHRLSSAYFPQSNGRAEVAVKTAKRLLMSNTGPSGSLNHDRFLQAMLQLRNTPDPDCSLSPAQIVFGRPLRDTLSFTNRLEKFSNPHVRPLWRKAWEAKEDALCTRMTRAVESLKTHSRPLRPLLLGERVFLQNQQGPHPNKWDRSGTIVEIKSHDQYVVKVDGSGRLSLRNRRFLRAYTPATPYIGTVPPSPSREHKEPCLPKPSIPAQPSQTTGSSTTSEAAHETPLAEENHAQEPPDHEVPTAATPTDNAEPAPQSTDAQTGHARPHRDRRPPKRYEPETGNWT